MRKFTLMFKYVIIVLFSCLALGLNAQNEFIGFGFRAGLSLSKIDGPSELGPAGEELEENNYTGGFHIGMAINFKFTDIMGLRTEVAYSQRGTAYKYNGPSYLFLGANTLQPLTLSGTRNQSLKVSNSYLDIPITAYYKIGYFEVFGGLNTGILLGSTAGGEIAFEGISPLSGENIPIEIGLNYNYKKDAAGQGSTNLNDIKVDGKSYPTPEFLGAYYNDPIKSKNYYKTLDLGLVIGLAYFLNDGLYLSGRYIHGLGDVDENVYDHALSQLSAGARIPRTDINKSSSWQISVGFSF